MRSKIQAIMSYLRDHSIDIAFIQESWLRKSDGHLIKQIEEYNYKIVSFRKPRRLDLGGGVAIVFKRQINLKQVKCDKYRSFESVSCQVTTDKGAILFSNVYRPDYSSKNRYTAKKFCSEYLQHLETLSSFALPTYIVGDYNFHLESLLNSYTSIQETTYEVKKKREAQSFIDVLSEFELTQTIDKPTHELGGTLDALICSDMVLLNSWQILGQNEVCSSDHFAIFFDLNVKPQLVDEKITFSYRDYKNFDKEKFVNDLMSHDLLSFKDSLNASQFTDLVCERLLLSMDEQCPLLEKTVKQRSSISRYWFTDDLKILKRRKRQLEREWKKCKCFYHKERYDDITKLYKDALDIERSRFCTKNIIDNKSDPKELYKSLRNLMGDNDSSVYPTAISDNHLADDMADFYVNKINTIRLDIEKAQQNSGNKMYGEENSNIIPSSRLENFEPLSEENVIDLIKNMNNKSHPDNPIPAWFIKEQPEVFAPLFRSVINKSFEESNFPSSLKHGTVSPVIKDKNIDHDIKKNYRPVTNIPFLPKLVERAANQQLQSYLLNNNLYPQRQSAYRAAHSCETTMFNVVNNIKKSISQKKVVMLVLLDLSSAFDTIDQDILLFKLYYHFGISGSVLNWLKSYLKGRTFSVRIRNVNGKTCLLIYGVPQGTVLGPLLFVLYINDIESVGNKHGVSIDLYADDSQWYISFSPLDERSAAVRNMQECMADLKLWMEGNYLKVNFDKTDVLFLGDPLYCKIFDDHLSCSIQGEHFLYKAGSYVESLGIQLDSATSMNRMVSSTIKSCYFQLKKLGGIKRHLDIDLKLAVIQSYVLSRLDFCNSLYSNISITLLKKLQSLLNACARFIYGIPNRNRNVMDYLKRSHLLPVKYRIMFKVCLIAFKIINQLAPAYLQTTINLKLPDITSNTRLLRSTLDFYKVELPQHENTLEYTMAKHWNNLPISVRSHNNVNMFKKDLKTHYFSIAFP